MKLSPRLIMLAGVSAAVPLLAMLMTLLAPSPASQPEPAKFFSDQPSLTSSQLTYLPRDADIVRIADAEKALQRANQALHDANYAFSDPDLPPRQPMWSADDSEQPTLELNPEIQKAEVIRLPALEYLEKVPGERITIPLLDGRSLAVTVEEANRLPNGDYSWKGYVEGEDDDFPVIFTVGKQSAFATITSWEGSYTMESVDGVGWLYKNIVDRGEDSIPAPADFEPAQINEQDAFM